MLKLFTSFALFVAVPVNAQSWDATFAGKISAISTSKAGNFPFRLFLDTAMSQCGSNFAYVDTSDPNYAATTAAMLTAFSLQKAVQLWILKDGGPCCRIVDTNMAR